MKKLLLLLSVLYINAFSQVSTSVNIVDYNTNLNNSLNIGDSSYVGVDYSNFTTDSFSIIYFNVNTPSIRNVLCTYKVSDLTNLQYYSCAYGHAYKIKFSIPNNVPGSYKMGIYGYGNCDNSNFTGTYNNPSVDFTINNTAGIEVIHSKENLISTEYFNLLGQPIIDPNGITVEVKIYLNGEKEIKKILWNN